MHKLTGKRKWIYQVAGVLFLAITLLIIYICNRAMPFMMDDNWYATKLWNEEPVQSLKDVIEAQVWHFYNWGGRSIAHGLLQLVLMSGSFWADIVNVLFHILLGTIICKVAGAVRPMYYVITWGMLYGLNANWSQSLCWHSGAANYLYMTTFILFFLWCYVRTLEGQDKALPGACLWMWPLGLAAGWSNENMGPTVWLLSLGILLYKWIKERKWNWWMLWGNLTCLAGSCLVILAPGNFVRSEQTISDKGLLWRIFLRCYAQTKAFAEFLSPTLLILACMLCLYIGVCGRRLTKKHVVYLLGALLSWGAMILSPHYPDRAAFGTMVFLICVILSMAKEVLSERPKLTPWMLTLGAVIWLRGIFVMLEYTCRMWGWI